MFRGVVNGCVQGRELAGYAGDVDDGFWMGRGRVVGGKEVGEGELGGADWMGEIDVEAGVAG